MEEDDNIVIIMAEDAHVQSLYTLHADTVTMTVQQGGGPWQLKLEIETHNRVS